ncbi:unnamed protein product [Durusdinium trenchii]|uniref:Radical SAM core domain-containing protein n=1 Tax=Durusdinium trenchii TaxID=1381693 RepID=A0ABP0QHP4_9DINO
MPEPVKIKGTATRQELLKDSETLSYRKPLPLSTTGFYEGVMIDDHLGVQLLPRLSSRKRALAQPGRDEAAFASAEEAYAKVGLEAHPKKRRRRVLHAQVWGAEIEGEKGLVGPNRGRLFQLAKFSAELAKPGGVDLKIVEAVTGLWAHCAQYRHVCTQLRCGVPPTAIELQEVPGLPQVLTSTLLQTHVSDGRSGGADGGHVMSGMLTPRSHADDPLPGQSRDGSEVEAVVIHHTGEAEDPGQRQADRCGERDTLCVSSQVGCRLKCRFCATGTMGLLGNLWAGEIQEQLVHARMRKGHADSVCNVVFMGMGPSEISVIFGSSRREPLENYEAVSSAVKGFVDPMRFGLAPSSLTVSTVGSSPQNMQRLLEELPKIRLAVSLHAPNQTLREELVPAAKAIPIDKLLAIVDDYAKRGEGKRLRTVMMSYVLLKDVNDSVLHARELSELLANKPVIVNLIPYNPFEGNVYGYEEPSPQTVDRFLQVLAEHNIRVFERRHHGRDIAAACGQLAKISKASPSHADIENCGVALNKELVRRKSSRLRETSNWQPWLVLGAFSVLVVSAAVYHRGRSAR